MRHFLDFFKLDLSSSAVMLPLDLLSSSTEPSSRITTVLFPSKIIDTGTSASGPIWRYMSLHAFHNRAFFAAFLWF